MNYKLMGQAAPYLSSKNFNINQAPLELRQMAKGYVINSDVNRNQELSKAVPQNFDVKLALDHLAAKPTDAPTKLTKFGHFQKSLGGLSGSHGHGTIERPKVKA